MNKLVALIPLLALVSCQPKAVGNVEMQSSDEVDPGTIDVSTTESLLGLRLDVVMAACDAAEVKHRVVEIDGKPQMATKDYRPERLNFAVKDGTVVAVTKG